MKTSEYRVSVDDLTDREKEIVRQQWVNSDFLGGEIHSNKSIEYIVQYILVFLSTQLKVAFAEYRHLDLAERKLNLVLTHNSELIHPYQSSPSFSLHRNESPASSAIHQPYGSPIWSSPLTCTNFGVAANYITHGFKSCYALSVRTLEKIFGVVTLLDTRHRSLQEFEHCLVKAVLQEFARGLKARQDREELYQTQIKLYETIALLNAQLDTDPLTGVGSRFAFERAMQEINSKVAETHPRVLIFADMDYFKQINDTLGHKEGDYVLRNTALCLKDYLRPNDHVWRTGGDELAIVLEGVADVENLMNILKKVRSGLDALLPPKVTLSLGLTFMTGNSKEDEKHADLALYAAKGVGRNAAFLYRSSSRPEMMRLY